MSPVGAARGRAKEFAATAAILAWMLLFSVLSMKNHHALSRLAVEVEKGAAAAASVAWLETRIAALERSRDRPSPPEASPDPRPDPITPSIRRRMR